uniref:Putative secreted protein n=1 Tax=Ixodes ricinus TaxID=34613 RepID=A0A6B0ULR1_IXORI
MPPRKIFDATILCGCLLLCSETVNASLTLATGDAAAAAIFSSCTPMTCPLICTAAVRIADRGLFCLGRVAPPAATTRQQPMHGTLWETREKVSFPTFLSCFRGTETFWLLFGKPVK